MSERIKKPRDKKSMQIRPYKIFKYGEEHELDQAKADCRKMGIHFRAHRTICTADGLSIPIVVMIMGGKP